MKALWALTRYDPLLTFMWICHSALFISVYIIVCETWTVSSKQNHYKVILEKNSPKLTLGKAYYETPLDPEYGHYCTPQDIDTFN